MALKDLLELKEKNKVISIFAKDNEEEEISEITEEVVKQNLPQVREQIAFFREYPDLFIDFLLKDNNPANFHFYTFQRVLIRGMARHKYSYSTFTRAFSKSFISFILLIIRAILFPGVSLFVTTGVKEQAADITQSKIQEICRLIPPLEKEIDWRPRYTKMNKDKTIFTFKNGSTIDVLAAKESSRGQRRIGGLIEECVLVDQQILQEVIIPTMNIDRRLPDGSRDPDEVVNKSQCYITSAGFKSTFAYSKNIQIVIQSIIQPDKALAMGGTYRIPVYEKLLPSTFIRDLKRDGTFNEASFAREFESRWGGDSEDAFFSTELFDKYRVLLQPEYEYSSKSRTSYYIIGVDVGRKDCTSEAVVIKVLPQASGTAIKSIVNIFGWEAEHFEDQAIYIKRLYYKFKARAVIVDGNGIGSGLIDYLVKDQIDPETGEVLNNFGVINDEEKVYRRFVTETTERDVLYVMKANAPINTEIYSYIQTQMMNGKIKFLIDENQAKVRIMSTAVGRKLDPVDRNVKLKPFISTTILREEMANLIEDNVGINIILKQATKKIKKDKFSALGYGMYFIKKEEENHKRRKRLTAKDLSFFN